jgi:hypothetical protein
VRIESEVEPEVFRSAGDRVVAVGRLRERERASGAPFDGPAGPSGRYGTAWRCGSRPFLDTTGMRRALAEAATHSS